MRKFYGKLILTLAVCLFGLFAKYDLVEAKNIVVVLDPGHGGENEGGKSDPYVEKEITIRVANAMKEELEKYEGITVYMTRTTDKDMSLKERVKYAKSVDADFLFCLHFNMSASHSLYGSECWVSAFGNYYAKGYDFAQYEMEELLAFGTYDRGIKTRIGKKGTDYYGIIRQATAAEIPSVIIEHCHMDNIEDSPYLDLDTWPEKYGVADATAVAKYYGLKSEALGVDYSTLDHKTVEVPSKTMKPDSTGPEVCTIDALNINEETGQVQVEFTSYDNDSRMLYYTYSFDGGETFYPYEKWPKGEKTVTFDIQLPKNQNVDLVILTHNLYDLECRSEIVLIPAIDYLTDEEKAEAEAAEKAALEEQEREKEIAEQKAKEEKSLSHKATVLFNNLFGNNEDIIDETQPDPIDYSEYDSNKAEGAEYSPITKNVEKKSKAIPVIIILAIGIALTSGLVALMRKYRE